MIPLRHAVILAGLNALSLTGMHRLLASRFAGIGSIFMMHHVRPAHEGAFQPNRHLEITPEFLRATLQHLRDDGVDLVTMDEVHRRLRDGDTSRRFATFTFDDGYRDNRDFALPIMREFDAPMTVYVASDFADARGLPWWVALERVVAATELIEVEFNPDLPAGMRTERIAAHTTAAKYAAYARLHDWLRGMSDNEIQLEVRSLCLRYNIEANAISGELCMGWDELRDLVREPLVTIGAHTVSHVNLARQSVAGAECEMRASRARIEAALQRPAQHLAYPYGDRSAAGPREFAMAAAAGFDTAVTTRPGMVFPDNAAHLTALPRLSLNGNYQDARFLPVLTSGAATAMWNGFRRVDAA